MAMGKRCHSDITEIVNNAFRDIVIRLGDIFFVHRISNYTIHSTSNAVEKIYNATMEKLAELNLAGVKKSVENKYAEMHPALQKLLKKIMKHKIDL